MYKVGGGVGREDGIRWDAGGGVGREDGIMGDVSGGEGEEGIKLMEAKGREVKDEWRGGEKGGGEGSVRRI